MRNDYKLGKTYVVVVVDVMVVVVEVDVIIMLSKISY